MSRPRKTAAEKRRDELEELLWERFRAAVPAFCTNHLQHPAETYFDLLAGSYGALVTSPTNGVEFTKKELRAIAAFEAGFGAAVAIALEASR